jgi:hypothetical protein
MTSSNTPNGDERNAGFGAPERVVDHKPGFEVAAVEHHAEDGKDHRRRAVDPKEVPQTPLARRLNRPTEPER